MVERMSARGERSARRLRAEADVLGVRAADAAAGDAAAPAAAPRPAGAESVRAAPADAPRSVESTPAPAATHLEAVARQMKLDPNNVNSRFENLRYYLGTAIFGSSVGITSSALAATALVGTLPVWGAGLLGAAVGMGSVMTLRSMLGLKKLDRMATAGRVVRKLEKEERKVQKYASRKGLAVVPDEAARAARIEKLSRRPSFWAIALGLATGGLFGGVSAELTTGQPYWTNKLSEAGTGAWERASDGNWWKDSMSWLWGKACGSGGIASPEAPFTSLTGETSPYPPPAPASTQAKAAELMDDAWRTPEAPRQIADDAWRTPQVAQTEGPASAPPIPAETVPQTPPSNTTDVPLPDRKAPSAPPDFSLDKAMPAPPSEPVLPAPDAPSYTGLADGMTVANDWKALEALLKSANIPPDDITLDLIEDYLEANPDLWPNLFGKDIADTATYQQLTRTMPKGATLDLSVLTDLGVLDEIIDRAQRNGYTDSVLKLHMLQDALNENLDANLVVRIK